MTIHNLNSQDSKGKGTANSIVKLAKSNSIVLRQYKFISQLAIKTGEFGDLENDPLN